MIKQALLLQKAESNFSLIRFASRTSLVHVFVTLCQCLVTLWHNMSCDLAPMSCDSVTKISYSVYHHQDLLGALLSSSEHLKRA
jgi:hypothetical protein